MRRILIWRKITKGNELDIYNQADYKNLYSHILKTQNGVCPNWGNKLWFQGLVSEIDTEENTLCFRDKESIDEINNNFDMIVYPMANVFGLEHINDMSNLADIFNKIKIPVYVIACGAQADSYDDLDNLIEQVGEVSKKYISAIYNTGGEFALRGEFTKRFFDKLGFSTACVTGCPSLYQFGGDFVVTNTKVPVKELRPVFNGKINFVSEGLRYFKNASYMDQDQYFCPLYNPKYINDVSSLKQQIVFCYIYGLEAARLLSEERIKHIADMNDWRNYLIKEKFNYSLGSRIHGSIMAILSGIPTTLIAADSRTREMAEFFDIPYIVPKKNKSYSIREIEKAYLSADYSKFNETFKSKYLNYQDFLVEHKIVSAINDNNSFFTEDYSDAHEKYCNSGDMFTELTKQIEKRKQLMQLGSKMYYYKNHC